MSIYFSFFHAFMFRLFLKVS